MIASDRPQASQPGAASLFTGGREGSLNPHRGWCWCRTLNRAIQHGDTTYCNMTTRNGWEAMLAMYSAKFHNFDRYPQNPIHRTEHALERGRWNPGGTCRMVAAGATWEHTLNKHHNCRPKGVQLPPLGMVQNTIAVCPHKVPVMMNADMDCLANGSLELVGQR